MVSIPVKPDVTEEKMALQEDTKDTTSGHEVASEDARFMKAGEEPEYHDALPDEQLIPKYVSMPTVESGLTPCSLTEKPR